MLTSENKEMVKTYKKFLVAVLIITFILSSFFGALFGFMAGNLGQGKFNLSFLKKGQNQSGYQGANGSGQTSSFPDEESAVTTSVEKASPAVVSIIISKDVPKMQDFFSNPFGFDPFFNPFGSGQQQQPDQNQGGTQKQEIGGGSGFIVSNDGLIVTNRHVVSDQEASYTVMTNDGKKYDAKVMAIDPTNDVAILKISASGLPVLALGDSGNLKIGQTVIAIGNSLGEFRNTVSKGIISGLKRNVTAGDGFGQAEQLSEVIQTDAAINPGNSGGPLLNINGQVIGVNVAMAQGAQSIGFALPIDIVKKDIDSVKTKGKIVQPFLGIRYMPITADIQKQNSLPYDYGALVVRGQQVTDFAVVPGSPADKAGIVENDIILEINGQKIDDNHQLGDQIAKFNVGETVTLKIWDKGQEKTVQVTLEERK
ncbi:MAG: trypsin-like peptidase domain-containing protein [Candidatus Moranbacteria bacterium]|nr:trypsin-like peptidase domain-containing protein [Candidatus Moranbacteria bacterium]